MTARGEPTDAYPVILFARDEAGALLVHRHEVLHGVQKLGLCGRGDGPGQRQQQAPPVHVVRLRGQGAADLLNLETNPRRMSFKITFSNQNTQEVKHECAHRFV